MEDRPTLSLQANQPVTSKAKSQRTQIREQKAFSRDYSGENEGQKAAVHSCKIEKNVVYLHRIQYTKNNLLPSSLNNLTARERSY